ncbi:MAG: FMN-binding negative transcriptional regulator [Yoonia sp.]|nr:FMN-binding negative transcriptional regulator [Yoonia sp.]
MYLPKDFKKTDMSAVSALIEAAPLATLVTHTAHGLRADHIPVMMIKDMLIGHIALANDLHQILDANQDVLAVFSGENAYISPNWYPSKADTHAVVPTWNYEVVHVHGRISFSHDRKSKLAVVGLLTKVLETRTNGDAAWRMADMPADFMEEKLNGIVAFDIHPTRILGKSKLSQNKSDADRLGAAQALEPSLIAAQMKTSPQT